MNTNQRLTAYSAVSAIKRALQAGMHLEYEDNTFWLCSDDERLTLEDLSEKELKKRKAAA